MIYQTAQRSPVRRPRRATPPPAGTVFRSRPRRRALAAWWRHRPNPVGATVVGLWCLFLAGVSYAYWSGPWTWPKTAVTLLAATAGVHLTMAAVWWAHRWHEQHQR